MPSSETREPDLAGTPSARRRALLFLVGFLVLYLALLAWRRDEVPQGINNDAAEKALLGIYLVEGSRFEVMTTELGYSAETLYLYLVGLSVRFLGPTTLAVQLPGWFMALATFALVVALGRRLEPRLPVWVPLLVAASSLWLFHYGRSGLRGLSAAVFTAGLVWLAGGKTRRRGPLTGGALLGGAAGLGVYAYTSCRLLPLALALWLLWRWRREPPGRSLRLGAGMASGFLLVSIPNLFFAVQDPGVFFGRGVYAVRGGPLQWIENLLWTVLLPLHYPALYGWTLGPGHFHDGVSITFEVGGMDPIHPVIGLLVYAGIARSWQRRSEPDVALSLMLWATGSVLLGSIGPSLTRLAFLLPVYLTFACLGAAAVLERVPRLRPVLGAALLVVWGIGLYQYFWSFPRDPDPRLVNAGSATDIGQRAARLASEGRRVLCVISKDISTLRFLTRESGERVDIVEFWNRPVDRGELALAARRPDVLLIEHHPSFEALASMFPAAWQEHRDPAFVEVWTAALWSNSGSPAEESPP